MRPDSRPRGEEQEGEREEHKEEGEDVTDTAEDVTNKVHNNTIIVVLFLIQKQDTVCKFHFLTNTVVKMAADVFLTLTSPACLVSQF